MHLYATFLAHFPPFCGYICLGEKWARTFPWASTCRQELDLLPRKPHRGTLSPALSKQNRWNMEGRGEEEWKRARRRGEVTAILDHPGERENISNRKCGEKKKGGRRSVSYFGLIATWSTDELDIHPYQQHDCFFLCPFKPFVYSLSVLFNYRDRWHETCYEYHSLYRDPLNQNTSCMLSATTKYGTSIVLNHHVSYTAPSYLIINPLKLLLHFDVNPLNHQSLIIYQQTV